MVCGLAVWPNVRVGRKVAVCAYRAEPNKSQPTGRIRFLAVVLFSVDRRRRRLPMASLLYQHTVTIMMHVLLATACIE